MLLHTHQVFCWPNDLSTFTEAKYPGEELRVIIESGRTVK